MIVEFQHNPNVRATTIYGERFDGTAEILERVNSWLNGLAEEHDISTTVLFMEFGTTDGETPSDMRTYCMIVHEVFEAETYDRKVVNQFAEEDRQLQLIVDTEETIDESAGLDPDHPLNMKDYL